DLGRLTPGFLGDIVPEEFLEGMGFADLDLTEIDSTQATFLDCALTRVNFGEAEAPVDLTGVRFTGTRVEGCRADTWAMPRGNLNQTEITGTRIWAGFVYDHGVVRFLVVHCYIDYIPLR